MFPQPAYADFGVPADAVVRLFARLIDIAFVVAIIAIPLRIVDAPALGKTLSLIIIAVVGFATFVVLETTRGWTPGKKLLRLRVRGTGHDTKPTAREAAIRNSFVLLMIGDAVPVVGQWPWSIAFIAIGMSISASRTNQGIHDRLAGGTYVVDVRARAAAHA